jgi:hypothetical protein
MPFRVRTRFSSRSSPYRSTYMTTALFISMSMTTRRTKSPLRMTPASVSTSSIFLPCIRIGRVGSAMDPPRCR